MSDRIRKINEMIREEAASAILERIGQENFITVTVVETSPDLKRSVIWVSVMGDETKALEDLNANKSEIQHAITGKMATKYTPQIEFKIDHSQDYVQKIDELLKDDNKER